MKIFNVKWTSTSAGPSPDNNKRTEIFLHGCKRAMMGNPCKNCFNPKLWDSSKNHRDYSVAEVVKNIVKYAPNKYITFVGGEPFDQIEDLSEVCYLLKVLGYHIIVFTNKELEHNIEKTPYTIKLLNNIDILIDGEYKETERIYQENFGDGLTDAVGSGNQIIWDISYPHFTGYAARDLAGIYVSPIDDTLKYITKNKTVQEHNILCFEQLKRVG